MRGRVLLLAGLMLAMIGGISFGATLDSDQEFRPVAISMFTPNAHAEVSVDPAMYEVQCANGSCSTDRGRRVRAVGSVTVRATAAVFQGSGPVRGAAVAVGSRAVSVARAASGRAVQAGGRAVKAATAPVRWLRSRAGGCG